MADKDIIKQAKDCFEKAESRESKNRERMNEALKFSVELEQWPDEIKRQRQEEGTPVFDKTNQYVRRIVNEMRVNTPGLKFRPVDDKADPEIARIYDGLWRHVCDQSQADSIFETAGEYATRGGFGYWRMVTEYCDPYSFDQDIRIKRISNCFSVLFGPHNEPTGADAKEAIVFEDMPIDDFKAKYPGSLPSNFESSKKDSDGWLTDETVRIAEYYKVIPRKMKILLLESNEIVREDEYKTKAAEYEKERIAAEAALAQNPELILPIPSFPKPIKERTSTVNTIKWYKLTGEKVLEERDVLGTMIPVFKTVGNFTVLTDGEIRTSGAVEAAMDSQRLHNYSAAKFAQQVALAPTAPYVGVIGQFKSKSNEWRAANRKNFSVLEYDPVLDQNNQPLPAPQRQPMPGVPAGWQQLLLNTEHGIEASFGMYGASIGGPSRERSGVALEQQQQQGEIGTLHYKANLAQTILQNGKVFLEWAPLVYDTERVARILGEDGTVETVFLNPEQLRAVENRKDEFGKVIGKSYNLNVGKYDVSVTSGPSFMTKRQEGASMMTDALKAAPEMMQLIGDLYFRTLDVPYADKIAERLKAMLPPQIQELEAQGDDKPVDPKVKAMMQRVEQMAQQLEARGQAVVQAEQEVKNNQVSNEADKAEIAAALAKLEAARKILMVETSKAQLEIELAGRKMMEDVLKNSEPEKNQPEVQEPQAREPSPPVIVVDSTVGPHMEAVSQTVQQVGNVLAQMTEQMNQNTGVISALVQAHNRPREVTVKRQADGSLIGRSH